MTECDVIVSGGGITGIPAALALQRAGFSVVLLENATPKSVVSRFGFDLRTLALSPSVVRWLHSLGLDEEFPAQPIRRMHVWEEDGTGIIEFDAGSVGQNSLAQLFEHHALVESLRNIAQDQIEILDQVQIESLDKSSRKVELSNGESLSCRLLVIAEGFRSRTREMTNARLKTQNLQQRALVTQLKISNDHNGTAWQKFGRGILALLPMPDPHVMSLVWSVENSFCDTLEALGDEDFKSEINTECEAICGSIEAIDVRSSFPLTQSIVNTFNPLSWVVLIGDAAHTIHPLAGQGVNLGLDDARALASAVKLSGNEITDLSHLRKFAQLRRIKAFAAMQTMALLSRTWEMNGPIERWVRNAGVRLVNRSSLVKNQIIREAMGFGPIGRLA